jgi:manganese/zinc/iron transport system substrate-binding protein
MRTWIVLICSFLLFACQTKQKDNTKISVVATTTIVSDIVQNILPSDFEINTLMGVGVDPHLYKSKSSDHRKLQEADVIVYSGLHLEGKMTAVFDALSSAKNVFPLSDGIPKYELIPLAEDSKSFDPHFWTDPELTKMGIQNLSKKLQNAFPNFKDSIKIKTNSYINELESMSDSLSTILNNIPAKKRILVTAHDAFSYFGKAYGFNIQPVQGVSTVTEAGLRDITNLINLIVEKQLPAIFIESSVSERNINAIVSGCKNKGFEVKIGGILYSDALGETSGEAGTYINYLLHNALTIQKGLNP